MDLATLILARLRLATLLVLLALHTCSATPGKAIFYEGETGIIWGGKTGRQAEGIWSGKEKNGKRKKYEDNLEGKIEKQKEFIGE